MAFERDVRAYMGSTVTLRCDSSGFDGRISWSRRDGRLPDRAESDDTSLTYVSDTSSLSLYLSVCLSVCLSVYLSACLPACLSFAFIATVTYYITSYVSHRRCRQPL